MFEIGFWELLFLAMVCLLVVGPKRLPALARTLGTWGGRLTMLLRQVRADIERELEADELRNEVTPEKPGKTEDEQP